MFFLILIIGALSGVLGGMGMGGGTILIPLLTLCFNINQHLAQSINLLAFIPMAILSLYLHLKNKLIVFDYALLIIAVGSVTCILGCIIAKNIDANLLKKLFGGFLIVLSIVQLITRKKID